MAIYLDMHRDTIFNIILNAAKLQWLEHLLNHGKVFETGVVRANECLIAPGNRYIFSIFFNM